MTGAIVLGASGFIGSAVVRQLSAKGVPVLAVSRRENSGIFQSYSTVSSLSLPLEKIETLPEYLAAKGQYDVLFNFAWEGSAGEKRKDAALQLNNVHWAVNSVKAAKQAGCTVYIGAGSIMEKEIEAACQLASARPGKEGFYSAAKQTAHAMTRCEAAEQGIAHIWGVITNAYGPGETSPRFLNSTLRKIIQRQPLTFTQGTQNYDFIYIEDAANAFINMAEKGVPFREYVVGSGAPRPLRQYILEIQSTLAKEQEFVFGKVPFTGAVLPLESYDISSLRQDTGFVPEVSFEKGITNTFAWIQEQEKGTQ